jgi:hypothetical protein
LVLMTVNVADFRMLGTKISATNGRRTNGFMTLWIPNCGEPALRANRSPFTFFVWCAPELSGDANKSKHSTFNIEHSTGSFAACAFDVER